MADNIMNYIRLCNKFISNNKIFDAVEVINKIENMDVNNSYFFYRKYLINKIKYKMKKIYNDNYTKKITKYYISMGENSYISCNYKDALNFYSIGLFFTYNPIFYYYLSKTYLQIDNISESECYLKKYLKYSNLNF